VYLISKYFLRSCLFPNLVFISIEKIKEKREEDNYQARVNAPDPDCPPGHVKVDKNEHVSTLQQLQFSKSNQLIR
jgi:hypothetical protein